MPKLREVLHAIRHAGDTLAGVEIAQSMWRFPVQHDFSCNTLLLYWMSKCAEPKQIRKVQVKTSTLLNDDRKVFPLKLHTGAKTKVNLFLRDVIHGAYVDGDKRKAQLSQLLLLRAARYSEVMYNDTATALYMWIYSALDVLGQPMVEQVVIRFMDEKAIKLLNNLMKTCGTKTQVDKSLLCEMTTMYGRATGEVDWIAENRTRTNYKAFMAEKAACLDKVRLREAIAHIYENEITQRPKFQSTDEYWSKRWVFTKSGGHQRRIERMVHGHTITKGEQVTRRMYAEAETSNILLRTKPAAYAGYSVKLEPGKSRALYGCDTVNYYHFDYVLREIERVWGNKEALLKPSQGDQTNDYMRWAGKMKAWKLMMDFDDFNSQHETEAKHMVFDELKAFLRRKYSVANEVLDWCVKSIKNEWIAHPDGTMDKLVGTLLSGHRATTFINTVLNAAYMRTVLGELYPTGSKHAGDDILMSVDTLEELERIAERVGDSVLRMNPAKQALGDVNAEFLRASFTKQRTRGYVSRAIASAVAGNWVNEHELGTQEYITNIMGLCWTHCLRLDDWSVWCLYSETFRRRVPELAMWTRELLRFRVSLTHTPVTDVKGQFIRLVPRFEQKRGRLKRGMADNATKEYMSKHVDYKLLKLADIEPRQVYSLMLEASYAKQLERDSKLVSFSSVDTAVRRARLGSTLSRKRGMLEGIFPFTYFQGKLDHHKLVAVLKALGADFIVDAKSMAWATTGFTAVVENTVPWNVASMWGKMLDDNCYVRNDYPVHI